MTRPIDGAPAPRTTSPWVERASRRELPGKAYTGDAPARESLSDIIRRTMPPVIREVK